MKKRVLSLALCLVLVVGLFSGLTVNASAGKIDDLKKEIAEKLIKEKIERGIIFLDCTNVVRFYIRPFKFYKFALYGVGY